MKKTSAVWYVLIALVFVFFIPNVYSTIPENTLLNNVNNLNYTLAVNKTIAFFAMGGTTHGIANYEINCGDMNYLGYHNGFKGECDQFINASPGNVSALLLGSNNTIKWNIISSTDGYLTITRQKPDGSQHTELMFGPDDREWRYDTIGNMCAETAYPNGTMKCLH